MPSIRRSLRSGRLLDDGPDAWNIVRISAPVATSSEEMIPRMRSGIDLTKAGLSLEEGFLASRIDGRTTVKDLALIVGKSSEETEKVLRRLSKAGVLILDSGGPADEAPAAQEEDEGDRSEDGSPYGTFIFPAHLMHEEGDLDEEARKRIVYFHHHLAKWTYYEILDVGRKADPKEIKKAYFERSKEWHPDRFRKPRLGSFKRLVEEIFRKVQDCYHTLSDPAAREKYDQDNVFMLDEDAISEMLAKQRKEEREKRREVLAAEKRKKKNPVRQRLEKARAFFEEAKVLRDQGQFVEALRSVQTSLAFEPRDEAKALEEELKVLAGEHRIAPHLRRGAHEESMTNWDNAITAYGEAVRLAPEHGEARLRLAYNMLMGQRDPHEANAHAQKAVSLLPQDAEAHFVLGMCYEKGGMDKAAIREFKTALDLKPNHVEAKKHLKKLKWGF
jgi:tetratricopeptide (TPR) repeat protein